MTLEEAPLERTRGYSAWYSHRLEVHTQAGNSHTGNLKNHNALG